MNLSLKPAFHALAVITGMVACFHFGLGGLRVALFMQYQTLLVAVGYIAVLVICSRILEYLREVVGAKYRHWKEHWDFFNFSGAIFCTRYIGPPKSRKPSAIPDAMRGKPALVPMTRCVTVEEPDIPPLTYVIPGPSKRNALVAS